MRPICRMERVRKLHQERKTTKTNSLHDEYNYFSHAHTQKLETYGPLHYGIVKTQMKVVRVVIYSAAIKSR